MDNCSIPKYLSADQIKLRELDILISFDCFTKQHGIEYSLAYGTMLGAIRHKGFIPWDDDIDVMVCREDYKKIIDYAKKGHTVGNYRFIGNEIDGYALPFIKLVDPSVIITSKAASSGFVQNLWIDVFPLDVMPNSEMSRTVVRAKCSFLRAIIKVGIYKFFTGGKTAYKRALKMLAKPFVKLFRLDQIAALKLVKAATNNARSSLLGDEIVCNICWGPYGKGECFPAKWMKSFSEVEFEGRTFPVINEWDRYLTQLYGDYMQLPPLKAQVAHEVVAYIDGIGGE